ncbi:ATP-binding cassette domain-containing protein [Vreelandella arcis]|uniref:Simple sugar transport system ATP-binding protein n=1 Tax=Vreelandella arcis TaxID=416873 RepID=A0A1H0HG49_9GAMM|nr:ATP-binding cassette domain-containing protein [Halomonas arcis]SDO18080.1 simple sugar transport system ATP-binding protein [Halomonas arcis]
MNPDVEPLLSLNELSKAYGAIQASRGVTFDIFPNEVVAMVGDNGAGKSTIVKMLAGVVKPDSGTIKWQGNEFSPEGPDSVREAGIETMFQDLALVNDIDAPGNLFMGQELVRRLFGFIPVLDRKKMRSETEKLLDQIKIKLQSLDRPVRLMSGGQRQAIAIARILLSQKASLIILDEPTAALGIQEQEKVLNVIRSLHSQGLSVLVISHNLEHVFSVADRIVVVQAGRIAASVATKDVSHQDVVKLIMGGTLEGKK